MPYGQCPRCGAQGKSRERSPDGRTTCEAGHKFISSKWDEQQDKARLMEPKRKGWPTPYGFIDANEPITHKEACDMAKTMQRKWEEIE